MNRITIKIAHMSGYTTGAERTASVDLPDELDVDQQSMLYAVSEAIQTQMRDHMATLVTNTLNPAPTVDIEGYAADADLPY